MSARARPLWATPPGPLPGPQGAGARLFRFYQDVLRLRQAHPAFRARNCQIVHVHDANRVIAFHCWTQGEDMLVVGCLNDWAFRAGYRLQDSRIADGQWREILNSDADVYGGTGLLNPENYLGGKLSDYAYPQEQIDASLARLPKVG